MNRKKIQHFFQICLQALESAILKEKNLLGLALCCVLSMVPGRVVLAQGVDSVVYAQGMATYQAAVTDYSARNWPAAFAKTGQAAQLFLKARDTSRACSALELQSNSCAGKDSLALAILDRAVRLYAAGPGDTSFVYFRLQLGRLRCLRSLERFAEVAVQADYISTLQDRLVEVDPTRGYEAVFNFMLQRADLCRDLGNLSKGIYELESALAFDRDNPDCVRPRYVAEAHSALSQLNRRAGNLPLAKEHHTTACDILASIPDNSGIIAYTLIRFQADLAVLLSEARKYDEATMLLRDAISDAQGKQLSDDNLEIAIAANLSNIYMRAGQLDSAWTFAVKAKQMVEKAGQAGGLLAKMEINLAAIHNKRQDYPAAILNARSAAGRITRRDAYSLEDRAKAWLEAGRAFLGLGLQDSVAICLHRLQAAQLSAETLGGPSCPSAWRSASEMHFLLANFDSAEVCLRRGMQACFAQALWQGNPARVDFDLLLVEPTYLALLKELGHLKEKRYQLTGCVADLGDAFRHYYRATRLIAYLDARRQDLGMATLAHERLWRDNVAIVEGAIRTAQQLHRLSHNRIFVAIALACADMSKARQLGKRSIASDDALAQQIDPALHAREKALAQALETDRRIAGSAKAEGDTAALAARLRVAKHKLDWEELMEEIRRLFPRYYALKYQDRALWDRVLSACFAHAPAGQASLEYFVGVDSVYGFLQTAEGLQMANLGPVQPLSAQVRTHKAAILTQQDIAVVAASGKSLSKALVPFALPRQAVQRLTIVPDGFLHGVSFHTLVWHGPLPASASTSTPYWVYGPAMGIGFSLTMQQAADAAAAFAPSVERAEGYFPKVEDTAARLFVLHPNPAMQELSGQVAMEENVGPAATKTAFLASFARPSIKEVKTHGLMDGETVSDPYLLMADSAGRVDRLYASELFGLHDLQPGLLVLNACGTAKGDYLPGEGVISFPQAFAKAGIGSLLANAWDAAEAGNDALLTHFYAAIAQGLSGKEALRQARIALLMGDDGLLRHPKYWACLEYYGAGDQPLLIPKAPRWPWLLGTAALLALLAWWRRRRTPAHTRPRPH
jgi:CHAT domain-containing protein